ncbi:hypothetical protein E2C01_076575 [Portunus trituberculatus]|uniref:Uncharacterized protein n=1 Tax=Portunus trituberculatus TaxID=210409 RepID=A0A5B7INX6_PORTR|nr:hypothetical protein [Portunus trituberculatus]
MHLFSLPFSAGWRDTRRADLLEGRTTRRLFKVPPLAAANQPASQHTNQPARQPASTPASEPGSQPASPCNFTLTHLSLAICRQKGKHFTLRLIKAPKHPTHLPS